MVNTIQPREYTPISRILPDPADSTTYYVQAIIRNGRTNTTIATVNLTSIGNHIFNTLWQTPADSSGQGLYITITTTVYTDSLYTVKSTTYGEDQDTFLIYDRFKFVQGLANQINALSSGSEVDYEKIKRLILKELKPVISLLETLVNREIKPVDLKPVLVALRALSDKEPPEQEEVNLEPLVRQLEGIKNLISSMKPAEETEIDLSEVLQAIKALSDSSEKFQTDTATQLLSELQKIKATSKPEIINKPIEPEKKLIPTESPTTFIKTRSGNLRRQLPKSNMAFNRLGIFTKKP